MKLDTSSFENAIKQLEASLEYLGSDLAMKDQGLRKQFRAAAIQAFEFTFELCVRMLRRQLKRVAANPAEVNTMDFMDMVRTAAEAGLVSDPGRFWDYRSRRNMTSHTYDESKAEEIASILDAFLRDVKFILGEMKRRNE